MMLKLNTQIVEYFLLNYSCHITSLPNSKGKEITTISIGLRNYQNLLDELIKDGHYINMIGKKPIKNKKIDDPSQWCVLQTPNHEWYVLRTL